MPKFFTVKEAAHLTGKSTSSIRRLIYPILDHPKHADRAHIEPNVKKATELRLKGESFPWRISEAFLQRIPVDESKGKTQSKAHVSTADGAAAAMIEMLRQELEIKNQQIAAQNQQMTNQNEIMKGLSERLREGNILIGSLQQQLSLGDGSIRKPSESGHSQAETISKQGSRVTEAPINKIPWYRKKLF